MLKKIICTVSMIILAAAPAFAAKPADINNLPQAEFLWHRGPDKSWEVNFNDAVSKAKEQNKKVFMLRRREKSHIGFAWKQKRFTLQ